MRAIIITLLIAALGAGGYFYYRQNAPAPSPMFAEPEPLAPLPTGEDCTASEAFYEYNDDPRLQLRFRRMPSVTDQEFEVAEFQGQRIGNMAFVVHATSFGADYVFNPVNDRRPASGPQYQVAVTSLRPEAGGAAFPVSMFNSEMRYIGQLPRNDSEAPQYVFMPGMLPGLYGARIDQPPGLFTFRRCEAEPSSAPRAQ